MPSRTQTDRKPALGRFQKRMPLGNRSRPNRRLSLNSKDFDRLFPFHIVVNQQGWILQVGHALAKACPEIEVGEWWDVHFQIHTPGLPSEERFNFESLALRSGGPVEVRVPSRGLRISGPVLSRGDRSLAILGQPVIDDLDELEGWRLLPEQALGDQAFERFQLVQERDQAREEAWRRTVEVVRLQVEMDRLREDLQASEVDADRSESLGVLAAGIAHEFNNLLMRIQGNAELAQLDLHSEHPASERLRGVVDATDGAADLCEQMLAFAGTGQSQMMRVELKDLMLDAIDQLREEIPENLRLEVAVPSDEIVFDCDQSKMRRVLLNLARNAAEAHKGEHGVIQLGGGRVTFRGGEPLPETAVGHLMPGEYVFLDVNDDGEGMDQETLDRLFDPFFTRRFLGRGLGMAVVYGVVRKHGGCVLIDSEPRKGTRVRVLLPLGSRQPKVANG